MRREALRGIRACKVWNLIVIGGGATGLGVAVDAATRGYTTLLLEAIDFAKGTFSRNAKLVHGGVRYLAQSNIALVHDALRERGRTRALLLDAQASSEIAERVAALLAEELGQDAAWQQQQVRAYRELAQGYVLEACAAKASAPPSAPDR